MMAPPTERIRILIVDDESGAREALSDIFDARGFDVVTAATGAEARAVLDQGFPDVALLDIRLPDEKGTDLLKEIRRRSDHTRCIMITGYSDPADTITALNYGASAYIEKPLTDIAAVENIIHEVVDKYRETLRDRQRLHELDIIKDVGEVAMNLDQESMLRNVLETIVRRFEADAGVVLLYSPADGLLRGTIQHNLSSEPIDQYLVKPGTGFAGRIYQSREVLGLESLVNAGIVLPQYLISSGVSTVLGAPLSGTDDVLGVLIVGWRRRRAVTSSDKDLLGVLAQRTALALENVRLYRKHIEAERRAQFLAEVGQLFNSTRDLREVVERVAQKATERLGNGCAIFLKNPGADQLDCVISYHVDPNKEAIIERHLSEHPVLLGEGVVGNVAVSGNTMTVTASELGTVYPDRTYLRDVGIQSSVSVPLISPSKIIGVLSCSHSDPAEIYAPEDVVLAEELAARASVAIENALLLQEQERRNQELAGLFRMSTIVTQSMEVEAVLDGVMQGAENVLEAAACLIVRIADETHRASLESHRGLDEDTARIFVQQMYESCADILRNSEPVIVSDIQSRAPDAMLEILRKNDFRSLTCVVLDSAGDQKNVLISLHRQATANLTGLTQLLKTLGGFAGVALANARAFERERRIAQELQENILPAELPANLSGVEVANDYHPALQEANVGGDFYDVFELEPDLYGLVIGDVSGKGLSAAVHTAMVKYTLRAYSLHAKSPAEVLSQVNDAMCSLLPNDIFITLFYGVLDARERVMHYASAGHDSPILCHSDGGYEVFESTGRALGLLSGARYAECSAQLQDEDSVLFYTDGITEARRDGQFLEMEGVANIVRQYRNASAKELVEGIYRDVRTYANNLMHDDVALLAIKVITRDISESSERSNSNEITR